MPKRGMAFGVFDGLHDGHKYFLSHAAAACEQLVVVVTQDAVVEELKHHLPNHPLIERMQAIVSWDPRLAVVAGDEVLGSWQMLREHRPDIILLGHDQQALAAALEKVEEPWYTSMYINRLGHSH